ncbi:hypothetical protein HaLaN_30423 [Haematococcus lacustris]|uniref:Uncharacterized protein n=1 Tax=Haematococcus lacustris TaxID=44745 RepID=A0A6A0AFG4_HAELA|nr:hypothetical protein HaLaN_30423 [Haematococcus lacustris]
MATAAPVPPLPSCTLKPSTSASSQGGLDGPRPILLHLPDIQGQQGRARGCGRARGSGSEGRATSLLHPLASHFLPCMLSTGKKSKDSGGPPPVPLALCCWLCLLQPQVWLLNALPGPSGVALHQAVSPFILEGLAEGVAGCASSPSPRGPPADACLLHRPSSPAAPPFARLLWLPCIQPPPSPPRHTLPQPVLGLQQQRC